MATPTDRTDDHARTRGSSRRRPTFVPLVPGLEGRRLLSVATFDTKSGTLTVDMARERSSNSLVIDQVAMTVGIDGRRNVVRGVPGGVLASSAVRRIVVAGSPYDDVVVLQKVSTAGFSGLDGKVSVAGNGGADTVYGSQFADTIDGGDGDDRLYGLDGRDTLRGGRGRDYLQGDNGADVLQGGDDADVLVGGPDADTLDGGAGDDQIKGDAGRDRYLGGAGLDNAWDWALEDYPLPADVELLGGRRR